jgi:OFA family oxalate/formate antiporter-like MFS transporter
MPSVTTASLLTLLTFVILMCYGGGFGTMPAFAADYFGAKNIGPIYGLMLTAWGSASAFGPLLIAYLRQHGTSFAYGLHVIAVILLISVVVPLVVRPPSTVVKLKS